MQWDIVGLARAAAPIIKNEGEIGANSAEQLLENYKNCSTDRRSTINETNILQQYRRLKAHPNKDANPDRQEFQQIIAEAAEEWLCQNPEESNEEEENEGQTEQTANLVNTSDTGVLPVEYSIASPVPSVHPCLILFLAYFCIFHPKFRSLPM